MSAELLDDLGLEGEPRPWTLPDGVDGRFVPAGLLLGQGANPLEVVLAMTPERPAAGAVRTLWEKRRGKRASPVFCVVTYRQSGTMRAAACGPNGDDPRVVFGLDLGQVGRICEAALTEPDRHSAARLVAETLPEDDADLPGLRNAGMFATHELRTGVAERPDWGAAQEAGQAILSCDGRDLVERLGFSIERRDTTTSVLRADGAARAVAVFLQESESPEGAGQRYGGVSPAAHALAAADREALPYVVLTRGRQIRLYAAGKDVGVGRKGRAETFVELNLAVLPTAAAGYLPLIFGAEALRRGGSFEDVLERSRDFATGLGERLRDRVYEEAVPSLAAAVAAHRDREVEADLDFLYEQAMVILFRLLFIAYAEDKDLLPYRASEEYGRRALKTTARELADRLLEGRDDYDQAATDLWSGAQQLFRAVELGNTDWQVPAYGGSLFSSDPGVSSAGAAIAELELTNDEFGPALAALLVDRTVDGSRGPVDFRSLSVREFGTIYEGLLESSLAEAAEDLTIDRDDAYVPASDGDEVVVGAGEIYLHNRSGARKATGSYFTKPFAVEHLLDHALEPAIDAHLDRLTELMDAGDEAGAGVAFFDFRCADIAMGSAHFLVAAVDRIEARLSTFLAERPVSAVTAELERLRRAAEDHLGDLAAAAEIDSSSLLRRQVARRCIYGVDRNLIAVELARLGIWIHTFVPGLPLSFLDRTLVWGDSLTGVGTLDEVIEELDPGVAEGGGQSLYRPLVEALIERTATALARLGKVSDADAAEVAAAREALAEAEAEAQAARDLLDLVIAIRLGEADPIESLDELTIAAHSDIEAARELAEELRCLHFPLTFPEVFLRERPGFDCILGNPPWEKLHVEEHAFWALRFPRLRALPIAQMNTRIAELRSDHPSLEVEFEEEVERAKAAREALMEGPYPDLGRSHPDLYKAFAWRFWHLIREDGAIGVVLPRSALAAAGNASWREAVLDAGAFTDTTLLLNNRSWVFDEVHAQYTVALVSIRKGFNQAGTVRLRGPYRDIGAMRHEIDREEIAEFPADDFRTWATGAAFPLLPSTRSGDVFLKLRCQPRFDDAAHPWRARPVQGDLNATTGKKHMILDPESTDELWPVYKGASFDIWEPDTGTYYAWADPDYIAEYLQGKRERGHRTKASAFSEMPLEWIDDPATMPCRHPRVAFRDVTNRTNTRTVVTTLIPPNCLVNHKAPYLLFIRGAELEASYLLGVLASVPLDWYARRFVETSLTFEVLNGFPIPNPSGEVKARVATIAGRLACPDERFSGWAEAINVDFGSVEAEEKDDLIAELDAAVAHLYNLAQDDVKHIFETFHEGWDYSVRLERVLAHFDDLGGLK